MVAVYSKTSGDFSGTRLNEPRSHTFVRPTDPSAQANAQYRDDSNQAPEITGRFFTPFVAQVLAQFDAAAPADPQQAVAAYRRTTEVRFEPVDILPPV